MIPALHNAELPDRVYRLGREPDPWKWPDWSYASPDGTFGNRFDDPEGQYRVLYASAERETTFRECLARFRPDPAIVAAEIAENDDDENSPRTLPAGRVALTWLQNRRIETARLIGEFCDIGHSASIVHLRAGLAARLSDYGLDDLDAGDIRLRSREALPKRSADARALLGRIVRGRLDNRVRDRIIAETGGNPLALLELARSMSASERAGGFVAPAAGDLPGQDD